MPYYDGDDDNTPAPTNGDERQTEIGDYDLGDEIGERIGEHEEDPSM